MHPPNPPEGDDGCFDWALLWAQVTIVRSQNTTELQLGGLMIASCLELTAVARWSEFGQYEQAAGLRMLLNRLDEHLDRRILRLECGDPGPMDDTLTYEEAFPILQRAVALSVQAAQDLTPSLRTQIM